MIFNGPNLTALSPQLPEAAQFLTAKAAVDQLQLLYDLSTAFLAEKFLATVQNGPRAQQYRAYYPEIRITTTSFQQVDSRLSFGHVAGPGTYATTVTRPDLFRGYLIQQIDLLLRNHDVPVWVGVSQTPIPIHFAMAREQETAVPSQEVTQFSLRDFFDVPDLNKTNDNIVNGPAFATAEGELPLAPFTAQRVDYSLGRLAHYTATAPQHFQNYVLLTNY